MKKIALLLLLLAGVVLPSQAEPGYVKFSLWDRTSAAIANNNTDEISGVDLGIGSYTPTLKGFQWDLIWAETFRLSGVSMSFGISKTGLAKGVQWAPVTIANELTGVQLGGVNMAGDLTGLQFGGINLSHRNITGGQLGFVNMGTTITGGQAGFFNSNHDFLEGLQFGAVNMSTREMTGLQAGFYNQADMIRGVQFGLLNYAHDIYGLQIGLFNIAENGYLPAMVFLNGRF